MPVSVGNNYCNETAGRITPSDLPLRSKSSITGKNLRIRPGRFSLSCRDEPGPLVLPHPCARAVTEQGHTDIREYCGWACSPMAAEARELGSGGGWNPRPAPASVRLRQKKAFN
jgi:hypothetical protein